VRFGFFLGFGQRNYAIHLNSKFERQRLGFLLTDLGSFGTRHGRGRLNGLKIWRSQ
jgi:hypothetical protein